MDLSMNYVQWNYYQSGMTVRNISMKDYADIDDIPETISCF